MRIHRVVLPVALLAVAACSDATRGVSRAAQPAISAGPGHPEKPAPPAADAFTEQRALLLLLEDRRLFEAGVLRGMLRGPHELREAVAASLGRIGRLEAVPDLIGLLADSDASVRRAAAFALGELNAKDSEAALLRCAADPDREAGALAVEALGKMGVDVARVSAAIEPLGDSEASARLLPYLFRFAQEAAIAVGERGLASSDGELRAWAAYGLARNPRPAALLQLRELAADSDPWVRALAARALGIVGEGSDLGRLRAMIEDSAAGPVIHALRAAQRLIRDGKAAAPRDWVGRLLELLDDPRPGVALTTLEASSAWLLDPVLGDRLVRDAAAGGRRGELALRALAEGEDPRAGPIAAQLARSENAVARIRAAEAAALAGGGAVLTALENDGNPGVRAAVVSARLGDVGRASGSAPDGKSMLVEIRRALRDPDAVVRATALDWLVEHPLLPVEELAAAARGAREDVMPDALLAAVRALRARTGEAMEKGACLLEIEQLTAAPGYLVRREAAAALRLLDRPEPEVGAAAHRPYEFYREVLERTRRARWVDLRLARGVIRLELDCPRAPQTCLSFLQLAAQGFFDGLAFHRVVSDFVVQGGDPRGDGSGGPGYELRDEINRLRYGRGALGMALSGPDTGGSQFFITLSPQPHLDGGYTIFGRVIEGMDLVDRIVQGERIERAVVLPGSNR
jgi:cyclophilin family peptidyl-prolyl cis-trans isomerase/HEAT repeat protein